MAPLKGVGVVHRNPEHFVIAQFSDLHCGGPRFDEHLLERVVREINEAKPNVVIVPGDLTADGYRDEYEIAKAHIEQLECSDVIVIPGNHDSRNVGYLHFVELFGQRWDAREMELGVDRAEVPAKKIRIVSVDSSKPDINDGEVGRHRYQWLAEQLGDADEDVFKIVVIHHHLVGIPNTGVSATSFSTRATCWRCSRRTTWTSCSPGTSTCRTCGRSGACSYARVERHAPGARARTSRPRTTS